MQLTEIPRPSGQADYYRFYFNEDTGNCWKVKLERVPLTRHDPNSPLSSTDLCVRLSASPVDEQGLALRDEFDRPIVTDFWNYTFNEWEMSQPGFDLATRLGELVEGRIAVGEGLVCARYALSTFEDFWKQ